MNPHKPKKIINLVGARPQFVKAAAISRALARNYAQSATEILVHSGQHYDASLSDIFFEELNLPKPTVHLGIGAQENQLEKIEAALLAVFEDQKPDLLIVYGDTTTTLAGALAAQKVGLPVAHIEAGLRSYNKAMPEEYNRVQTDLRAKWLFAPTVLAVDNLTKEGIINQKDGKIVAQVGDVMLDCIRLFAEKAVRPKVLPSTDKPLVLLTLHRNFNADYPEKILAIINALAAAVPDFLVIFPVHPRTLKNLDTTKLANNVCLLDPVSYFEMLWLERESVFIATDSGGVQKEAFYFKIPLVIFREETEWHELVQAKVAFLVGNDAAKIANAVALCKKFKYPKLPNFYGDAHAAERICEVILRP